MRLRTEGREFLTRHDYESAIPTYKLLIAEYEKNPRLHTDHNRAIAYYSFGLAYLKLNNFTEAYPNLKKSVDLDSQCQLYHDKLRQCEAAMSVKNERTYNVI